MLRRLFEKLKLIKPRQPHLPQTNVSGSLRIITEQDVMNHCRNSGATEFMCKNCGSIHNALSVTRNYCNGCNCWLCWKCNDELCSECKQ